LLGQYLIATQFWLVEAFAQSTKTLSSFDFTILADRSVVWTAHEEITPPTQATVQSLSQLSLQVQGNQTLEIIDAYTRKPNGSSGASRYRDAARRSRSADVLRGPDHPAGTVSER
jgi:hypothetical protein